MFLCCLPRWMKNAPEMKIKKYDEFVTSDEIQSLLKGNTTLDSMSPNNSIRRMWPRNCELLSSCRSQVIHVHVHPVTKYRISKRFLVYFCLFLELLFIKECIFIHSMSTRKTIERTKSLSPNVMWPHIILSNHGFKPGNAVFVNRFNISTSSILSE